MKSKTRKTKPPIKRFQLCIDAGLHRKMELVSSLLGYATIADLYAEAAREKLDRAAAKSATVRIILRRAS